MNLDVLYIYINSCSLTDTSALPMAPLWVEQQSHDPTNSILKLFLVSALRVMILPWVDVGRFFISKCFDTFPCVGTPHLKTCSASVFDEGTM